MTVPSDLIARLEAAKDGSRELDRDIYCAVTPSAFIFSNDGMQSDWPSYTTSLDAALTLVPTDRNTILKIYEAGEHVAFCLPKDGSKSGTWTKAATPSLALCIAALKARETGR